MRRSLITLLLAVVLAVAGLGLGVSAGGAAPSAHQGLAPHIICPLAGGTATTPCCGPPISGAQAVFPCCTGGATTACPVPAVSISALQEPSLAGEPVTISGVVSGGATAVELWQELPGQTAFRSVASTTAGSDGAYGFELPAGVVTTNRRWYVTAGGLRSATVNIGVMARISLAALPRRVAAGHRISLSGRIAPSHAGERVLLQRRTAAGWTPITRARLSAVSRFRAWLRFAHAGRVHLRFLLPADARNVESETSVFTLTVTRGS